MSYAAQCRESSIPGHERARLTTARLVAIPPDGASGGEPTPLLHLV